MKLKLLTLLCIVLCSVCISCKKEDINPEQETSIVLSDEVKVYEQGQVDKGVVLIVENGGESSYIVDKTGKRIFTWEFDNSLGNDFELLSNGKALGIFKPNNEPPFSFGGYGGVIKIVNPDGSIDWEYNYVSDTYIAHHDVELLPNGNVLFLVWERIVNEVSKANGVNFEGDIFLEKLVEINPNTNAIVWEWRSWDHIVQDYDNTKPNYDVVADNPQLININYNLQPNGDFMHANGIDYDAQKDIIYVSVNFFSEVWVIDHSTTTAQAATNNGGTYGKGGDLLYRFGNPEAYNNLAGERLFFKNHFPNLLEDGKPGEGNLLIYVNTGGENINQSTVYELEMPTSFSLTPNTNNEPNIIWDYTDTALFNEKISGAVRLSNGNTLICEGDFGYWEVTPNKEIVWKYTKEGAFWRGYSYDIDFEGLENLGVSLD